MPDKYILLVDDEKRCIDELMPFFSSYDFPIKTVSNGQDALNILESSASQCALLVTDLSMPAMTGLQLIFEVYKRKFPLKYIILNTSCAEDRIDLSVIQTAVRRSFQVIYSEKQLLQQNMESILAKLNL